ncbi:MAG: hypothetical protein KAI98_00235 [Gemmatimonadetes bacterium]|nr:hypothetical protein [Gemmatimonadota bacterium]
MLNRTVPFEESLVVWSLIRRYLGEMRRDKGRPRYDELAAEALARLSVGGVHQLCGLLKAERDELRELEDGRSADSLTSAIRDLDSRTQILDDLLR